MVLNQLAEELVQQFGPRNVVARLDVEPRRDLLEHRNRELERVGLNPRGQRVDELHPLPRPP